MPQRQRDTETGKERRTRRQGDRATRRQGNNRLVILSPLLLVSLSLSSWLCVSVAGSRQKESFEKQALSSARDMPASSYDEALPELLFGDWINGIVGPKAGVVWQLTECGQQIGVPGQPGYDLPACAEINATLPDGRKLFVAISVGTFKKGPIGKPRFFHAVIEQNEQLYRVRRLRDIPKMMRAPAALAAAGVENRMADPPEINMDSISLVAPFRSFPPMSSSFMAGGGDMKRAEESPPAPPPPPALPMENPEMIPESVSQSRAINKVKPDYPQTARKMNAIGAVEVEIVIAKTGLVVEATAISGHMALRTAAVEAARKWIFEPAMIQGSPVRVKSVLTFVFAPSAK